MKSWSHEITKSRNHETTKSWNHEFMTSCNFELMKTRNHQIMKPWNHEGMKSWIMEITFRLNLFRKWKKGVTKGNACKIQSHHQRLIHKPPSPPSFNVDVLSVRLAGQVCRICRPTCEMNSAETTLHRRRLNMKSTLKLGGEGGEQSCNYRPLLRVRSHGGGLGNWFYLRN